MIDDAMKKALRQLNVNPHISDVAKQSKRAMAVVQRCVDAGLLEPEEGETIETGVGVYLTEAGRQAISRK